MTRQWEHPEPGISFTYAQWKEGDSANALVGLSGPAALSSVHDYYSVSLEESFWERGLQVIVKMAGIELTPTNSSYENPEWLLDSLFNEHIAATEICYYDIENCTTPRITFGHATTLQEDDLTYMKDLPDALCSVYGVSNSDDMWASFEYAKEYSGRQKIGTVSAPQGRLLTWPNLLQHKFENIKLIDESQPGYAKYIMLSLVDPYYRICSTRNVPPQRHDWWYDEAARAAGLEGTGLPQEVIDMIGARTDSWPMGMDEAKDLYVCPSRSTSLYVPRKNHEANFSTGKGVWSKNFEMGCI